MEETYHMAVGRAELVTKEEEVEIFILALLASKPSATRRPTLLPAANSISLRLEDLYTRNIIRQQRANACMPLQALVAWPKPGTLLVYRPPLGYLPIPDPP